MAAKFDVGCVLHDRYCLAERSHRDTFGEVWLARDTLQERTVVVRALSVDLGIAPGSSSAVAALAKRLSHARVASIVDLFREDDRWFLASEVVSGQKLDEYIVVSGPLSAAAARQLAIDLGRGLRAIHAAGGVHGRLDPSRVQIFNERATIVDVGLGMLVGDESEEWRTTIRDVNDPMLAFLSPEQAAGDGPPTPESDVWALGAIVYFALHGRSPFAARTRPELSVATARTILPLEAANDRELAALIGPCLAREPALRPAIDEVIDAATSALNTPEIDRRRTFSDVSTPGASLSLVDGVAQRRSSPAWHAPRSVLFGGIFVTFLLLGLVLRAGERERRAAASAAPPPRAIDAPIDAPSAGSTSASAAASSSAVRVEPSAVGVEPSASVTSE